MTDFVHAREVMVDCQVRTADVTDHALISAMLHVPREAFVPEDKQPLSYIDEDISLEPVGPSGRYLMEPAAFAKLAQLARFNKDDVVLVIGAASGYPAAVISMLCSSVVAIEEDDNLFRFAEDKLSELGYDNVAMVKGEFAVGWPGEAPFDVIFVAGAVDFVPDALLNQLDNGGRLVVVEGVGNAAIARIYSNDAGITSARAVMNCAVRRLPGFEKSAAFEF